MYRNILIIKISSSNDTAKIIYKKDVWAKPQAVLKIIAPNDSDFRGIFQSNKEKIVTYFVEAEKQRVIKTCSMNQDRDISINTNKNTSNMFIFILQNFIFLKDLYLSNINNNRVKVTAITPKIINFLS